ncbi:MAG: hypothetical protein JWQ18_980, partial [Conexibacter sp.]|nr:hypothetical protein [Conexibacter sp.]
MPAADRGTPRIVPRSRSLLVVGLLALVAAAVGGLAGARLLTGGSSSSSMP